MLRSATLLKTVGDQLVSAIEVPLGIAYPSEVLDLPLSFLATSS